MAPKIFNFSSGHYSEQVVSTYALCGGLLLSTAVTQGVAVDAADIDVTDIVVGILIKDDGVIKYVVNGAVVFSEALTVFEYYSTNFYIEVENDYGYSERDFAGRSAPVTVRMWHEFYSLEQFGYDSDMSPLYRQKLEVTSSQYEAVHTLSYPLETAVVYSPSPPEMRIYDRTIFWHHPAKDGTTVIDYFLVFCAEAIALFARMTVEPSRELKVKINALIVTLKLDGTWDLLDTLYVPLGGETEQAMLLDWKRSGKSAAFSGAVASTSATYGFEVGASSYVDTDYNPAVDATNVERNSHTTFAWVTKLPDWTGGPMWHPIWQRASNTALLRSYDHDYRLAGRANGSAELEAAAAVAALSANELYAVSRSSSTSCALYKGSTAVDTDSAASAAWAGTAESNNLRILELASSADVTGGVGVFGMGGYLSPARLASLKSALQAFAA